MLTIETIPQNVLIELAFSLDPADIARLAQTCKTFFQIYSSNELWRSKTHHDFGNLFAVYHILTTSGLELDPALGAKFANEPSNWRQYYIEKNNAVNGTDAQNNALLHEGEEEYIKAQKDLQSFQDSQDVTILSRVASKLVWILDVFPGHAGCYHLLGFILYILNRLEEAMMLLDFGRTVDPEYEPIDDLEEEISKILNGYKGSEEEEPLIKDHELTPKLAEVLSEIFETFDQDHDGALNNQELGNFIFTTNGSHPPPQFLVQIAQRFGGTERYWLTKDGFLAFYLEQTLDDPTETRSDLSVHGYDGQTLQKMMQE
ncbi:hypothetical protein K450DRAFT_218808 [Umbelopsis ramanniana AG]|uniref:EF-hand domain-containing protein n=1 Tax=Umbelopsis ramanniana AG TaxID=1314678 RepID=A0AAD5HH42_UMBRA|nr:uncharacterized protein K450DRAFT_218808 [Umbelopsis ramanniana AG]KAI8584237.1 hypothetical protein K450DRAFT_218808 [Umbelopsis ramanniana AG]